MCYTQGPFQYLVLNWKTCHQKHIQHYKDLGPSSNYVAFIVGKQRDLVTVKQITKVYTLSVLLMEWVGFCMCIHMYVHVKMKFLSV